MPLMVIEGEYLGHTTGEFTDQEGKPVEYGKLWLWDATATEAVLVKPGQTFGARAMDQALQGYAKGDTIRLAVEAKAFRNEIQYRLHSIQEQM